MPVAAQDDSPVAATVDAPVVAAVASPGVAEALTGPLRAAPVVSAGPRALYVHDGTRCVAVLARDAIAVPCGLRTRLATLPEVRQVTLGDRRCVVGAHVLAIRRLIDTSVPTVGALTLERLPSRQVRAWAQRTAAVRAELPRSALEDLRAGDPAAVPALLGRGTGLTPVGDDVLAGWLVARHAIGTAAGTNVHAVGDVVRALAPARTTNVSAALLQHAVAGESIPQLRSALLAFRTGVDVASAVDALLAVGHTSGAGLALGVELAVEHDVDHRAELDVDYRAELGVERGAERPLPGALPRRMPR